MPDVPTDAPIVIVGAGLAGYTLAKELRKLAPEQPITLITADSGALYSKPMLSNALAQGQSTQALVQATALEQANKLKLDIKPYCSVTAIHPGEHALETACGTMRYRHLVLALGAHPRPLDFPGAEHALSVNHLDDYVRFRERLTPAGHIVILGAGLVGCEFANDLATSGHEVTLVEAGDRPLERMAPAGLSQRMKSSLASLGVDCRCGSGIVAISPVAEGYEVILKDGTRLHADLVLAAAGLIPETSLAQAAALKVGRGIVVNEELTCSTPDIHALGDCVEINGLQLQYVLPLMQQARALAATLTGTPTRLTLAALPIAVKTPACPLVLCPPPNSVEGTWQCERDDPQGASHPFLGKEGNLLGFALAGDACGLRRQFTAQIPAILP